MMLEPEVGKAGEEAEAEIRLRDLWSLAQRRWPIIVFTSCIVFAGALALASVVRVQYQADAIIRIGQFYDAGFRDVRLVESVPLVIERLRRGELVRQALDQLPQDVRQGVDVANAIRAEVPASGIAREDVLAKEGLLSLAVRAPSPEAARRLTELVISKLEEVHAQIVAKADARTRKMRESLSETIGNLRSNQTKLLAALPLNVDASSPAITIAREGILAEIAQLNAKLDKLNERLTELDAIGVFDRRSTAPFTAVSVQDKPVSANKRLILVIGVLLGSSLGAFFALLADYVARQRLRAGFGKTL